MWIFALPHSLLTMRSKQSSLILLLKSVTRTILCLMSFVRTRTERVVFVQRVTKIAIFSFWYFLVRGFFPKIFLMRRTKRRIYAQPLIHFCESYGWKSFPWCIGRQRRDNRQISMIVLIAEANSNWQTLDSFTPEEQTKILNFVQDEGPFVAKLLIFIFSHQCSPPGRSREDVLPILREYLDNFLSLYPWSWKSQLSYHHFVRFLLFFFYLVGSSQIPTLHSLCERTGHESDEWRHL